jgi:hypothetical protein
MRRSTRATLLAALLVTGCGSAPPSTAPVPSPSSPADAVATLAADAAELPAGRYAAPAAVPGVEVVLEPGWSSGAVGDAIELRRNAGGGDVAVVIAMLDAPSAAAAADTIAAAPGVTVLATSGSRMSGQTGPNLELENASGVPATLIEPLELGDGERMWLSMFDTSAGVLAIAVRSATTDWEAALLAVEPFLEGVAIAG